MFISQQKEQFSRAYVRAVAAAAGYGVAEPQVDDDSIDCTICSRGRLGKIHSPKVDLQLKCTTDQPGTMRLAHRLKIKNFDDLRDTEYLLNNPGQKRFSVWRLCSGRVVLSLST